MIPRLMNSFASVSIGSAPLVSCRSLWLLSGEAEPTAAVGVRQLTVTPTTLSSGWKWQVGGNKGLGAGLRICPIALTADFTLNFLLLLASGSTCMNAWSDSWSLNISLDGIDFLFACAFDRNLKKIWP